MSDSVLVKTALQESQLEDHQSLPLYINKVTINQKSVDESKSSANTASSLALSEKFYQPLLQNVLEHPIQNIQHTVENLSSIGSKIQDTGLFERVDINVEVDNEKKLHASSSANALSSPVAVSTTINVFPKLLSERFMTTKVSSENLNSNEILYRYIKYNAFGKAEKFLFTSGLKYDTVSHSFKTSLINTQFLFPLPKNPSTNGVVSFNYINKDRVLNDNKHFNFCLGFQKNWINSELFGGLSFTRRSLGNYSKTGIITSYIKDGRSFIGLFPVSGSYLKVDNDVVFAQTHNGTVDGNAASYNKMNIKLDLYKSFFRKFVTTSLESNLGFISKLDSLNKLVVEKEDKFSFPNLKGFQYHATTVKDLGVFNCKIASSFKLPFKSNESPLRFQVFTNFNQLFNPLQNGFSFQKQKLYSAYGCSLVYKTDLADFDLSYSIPLSNDSSSISAPGFSMSCALSFF